MLTDYAHADRQRLIHPRLRDIIHGLVTHVPDPGMPWPDDGISIAVARCAGDAKTLSAPPTVCRCAAFEWPHSRGISTRCSMRPRRRLKSVIFAPEMERA